MVCPVILVLRVPQVRGAPGPNREEGLLLDFHCWVMIEIWGIIQASQAHFRHAIIIVIIPLI